MPMTSFLFKKSGTQLASCMFTEEIINQKRNTPHDSMALVNRITTVNVYSEPLVFILNPSLCSLLLQLQIKNWIMQQIFSVCLPEDEISLLV